MSQVFVITMFLSKKSQQYTMIPNEIYFSDRGKERKEKKENKRMVIFRGRGKTSRQASIPKQTKTMTNEKMSRSTH